MTGRLAHIETPCPCGKPLSPIACACGCNLSPPHIMVVVGGQTKCSVCNLPRAAIEEWGHQMDLTAVP